MRTEPSADRYRRRQGLEGSECAFSDVAVSLDETYYSANAAKHLRIVLPHPAPNSHSYAGSIRAKKSSIFDRLTKLVPGIAQLRFVLMDGLCINNEESDLRS